MADIHKIPLSNLLATVNPGVNDDIRHGYSLGSQWVNNATDQAFILVDPSYGAAAWYELTRPGTTKGDVLVHDGSNDIRLAVGSDAQVLTADSTQASGVKWAAAGGGGGTSSFSRPLALMGA